MDNCYGKYKEFNGYTVPDNLEILSPGSFKIHDAMFGVSDWPSTDLDLLKWKLEHGENFKFEPLFLYMTNNSKDHFIVTINDNSMITILCNNQLTSMTMNGLFMGARTYKISIYAGWPWAMHGGGYHDREDFGEAVTYGKMSEWLQKNMSKEDIWTSAYIEKCDNRKYCEHFYVHTYNQALADKCWKKFYKKMSPPDTKRWNTDTYVSLTITEDTIPDRFNGKNIEAKNVFID